MPCCVDIAYYYYIDLSDIIDIDNLNEKMNKWDTIG
jgi:hypothetical protein